MTTLVVIAKETIPGKVKTRLHPPLSLEQAADVAAAAIQDTLDVVRRLGVMRTPTTLVLDRHGRELGRAAGAPTRDQVARSLPVDLA